MTPMTSTSATRPIDHLLAVDPASADVLFRQARTANTFTDEPVTDEQVEAIHELMKWGPTAFNCQPLRMLFVRSAEARERLVSHMSTGNKAKTSTAPLVAVLCVDSRFHEVLPTVFPVSPTLKDSYADEQKRLDVATPQAWLQAGYVIMGIRALGLAAGPMLGFNRATLDADLLADTGWRSIAVVNIGRPGPDAWRDRLPRLDLIEVSRTV